MWQKSCKVLVRLFQPLWGLWLSAAGWMVGLGSVCRRGWCCEAAGVTLGTLRWCRAPAASPSCSVGSFGIVPQWVNMTTLLMLPALCRS